MRHFPGWVVGALGTAALVGAFYAGGALSASSSAPIAAAEAPTVASAPADASALDVECEPGQRAVVRQASAMTAGSVACVSSAVTPARAYTDSAARVTRVAYGSERAYAQPAVIHEPLEVYRPRTVPVSYGSREVSRPTRSAKKSAVIIAGSTAAGAVIGGLAKGKKGALIGGIVSGGAATVWDQVTRRRNDGER